MNRGNRNNASGHQRGATNAGSSSGKSALTPDRGVARNNKNSGSSSGNNWKNGSSSRNNRNNGSSSQSKREEDDANHVPGTNVVRIMRTVLPAHAKISDAAKEAVQECVTEYISLLTSEANERCLREHRKTLTPEDLLYAMAKLGFDDYIQPLTLYLNRYRESESERTCVNGEPTVFRTVNYQHLLGPQPPPPHTPPPPPPPIHPHFNPQVAPLSPPMYIVNRAEATSGFQGYRAAPPGRTVDIAGPSTNVAYAPAGSTSVYPYRAAYPPPPLPGVHPSGPSGQFFQ